METVAGVFRSRGAACDAADRLRRAGFSENQVNLLLPGATEEQIHSIPTADTEQPGVGGALAGVVGASLGMAGGFELGAAAASVMPGVGPVLAAGIAAAALLGTGGAIGGASLGAAADARSTQGVPADEVFFYEDALRQGRSVVILLADGAPQARRAREMLAQAGAESLDAARQAWWVGLRDAEEEHYRALGENFDHDEEIYRAGFQAALCRECRGRSIEEAEDRLKWIYPRDWDKEPFRRGYERGREYWRSLPPVVA